MKIKYFCSKISLILTIGIIFAVIISLCWYCYKNYQVNLMREISLQYENLFDSVNINQSQVLATAEKFALNNKNNIYGILAMLKIAHHYVNNDELEKASVQLKQGLATVNDYNLRAIIITRLARIQVQQKQYDEALKTLDLIKKNRNYIPIIANIRGDALFGKGDKKKASDVWAIGVKNNVSSLLSEFMKMKINNISTHIK